MAGQFRVDLGELDDVIAEMSKFDQDAESLCAHVDQLVARLHVTWAGDAAEAQRVAHERWKRGAEEMRSAVTDLRKVGKTAHSNYSAAVKANVGMWPT